MKKALQKKKPKASLNNHDRFVLCGLFSLLGRFGLARSDKVLQMVFGLLMGKPCQVTADSKGACTCMS